MQSENNLELRARLHYGNVIKGTMVSQSSASLAFVRGINREYVNSPHKGPVTRKMFPFDDVIMQICMVISWHAALSALLLLCEGNPWAIGGFPSLVLQSSNGSWTSYWTGSRVDLRRVIWDVMPLMWRHCNGMRRITMSENMSHITLFFNILSAAFDWGVSWRARFILIVLCLAGGRMTLRACAISTGSSGARPLIFNTSNFRRMRHCCVRNHLPSVMSRSEGRSSLETTEDMPKGSIHDKTLLVQILACWC